MIELNVRHSVAADIAAIKTVYAGPIAIAGTLQLPYVSDDLWEQRLNKPAPGAYSFVAEHAQTIVGHLGFSVMQNPRRKHVGTFGMAVLDDFERKGVGSALVQAALDQADNWLDLTRIEITAFIDNTSALALYKKHGFEVEGELKQFAFRNGEYVNAYTLARLKPVKSCATH